ncbi:hypothetical protein EYZ11_006540 [Aspergillus tanneri]|uniref:Uncharacterized protein n=1 Tax=Aspergillus tanneri TaxID=1220188 RepID=A0A4S3JF99_9EURO|nr:uncharacterized protein ATNIH1004_000453 [Aspergillus tanneri]KAA8651563.1 hypothetical protein ATNIH1004_000453 [Aspergillus tanneri]THC93993.1 hypothetical protein EYZ11_006540 [Aspergillus tanneri]
MDSPSRLLSSPSKALNPLSPDRINQQPPLHSTLSASDIFNSPRKSARGSSDVQAKVAFLNNLSRTGSPVAAPPPPGGGTAALQRAILGREEAESALASVSAQLSEAQSRERRISERLESLLEELQASKERKAHERTLFEKEIRKARKEAFRAGSTLVKTQEELKQARTENKGLKDEVESERKAKEKAKQEAFERAYAIAGITEELEEVKGQLRAVEAKNNSLTLKTRAQAMRRQDAGRMSLVEGDLAFLRSPAPQRSKRSVEEMAESCAPESKDASTQCTPPKKPRLSDVKPQQEVQEPPKRDNNQLIIRQLQETLRVEKRLRTNAEDLTEFLRMECQFKRCSCRIVEEQEKKVHKYHTTQPQSTKLATKEKEKAPSMKEVREYQAAEHNVAVHPQPSQETSSETTEPTEGVQVETIDEAAEEPLITFSPITGTFHTIPSPVRGSVKKQPAIPQMSPAGTAQRQPTSPLAKYETNQEEIALESGQPASPETSPASDARLSPAIGHEPLDDQPVIQNSSNRDSMNGDNLRKVPLRAEGSLPNQLAAVPGTPISREEALAQIRARRGRTNTMKRSVSATESTLRAADTSAAPGRMTHRIPGVQNANRRSDNGDIRSRRDLSAPVRMTHR